MAFTFTPAVRGLYLDCEQLRQRNNQVFLIFRLDNNDATLRAMWDAPYAEAHENWFAHGEAMYQPADKMQTVGVQAQLLNEKGKPVPGKQGVLKGTKLAVAERQGGGHAEEFFLQHLMAYSNTNTNPAEIDLYISRIPCAETSMAWQFTYQGNQYALPAGCGPKLYFVMQALNGIQWNLAFGEGYPNQQLQAKCLAWVDKINTLPNAAAHHISNYLP